jgi:hypothetical protein
MVRNIRVNGLKISITEKVKKITQMVLYTMENSFSAKSMERELTSGLIKQFILETGGTMRSAEKEHKNGQMEGSTMANGGATK